MTEDEINKIECLIGWVKASGEGKYPLGSDILVQGSEEAQEWIDEIKERNAR